MGQANPAAPASPEALEDSKENATEPGPWPVTQSGLGICGRISPRVQRAGNIYQSTGAVAGRRGKVYGLQWPAALPLSCSAAQLLSCSPPLCSNSTQQHTRASISTNRTANSARQATAVRKPQTSRHTGAPRAFSSPSAPPFSFLRSGRFCRRPPAPSPKALQRRRGRRG